MLRLSDTLIGKPIMSLRTGQPVATSSGAIIDPNNLKIEGFYCIDRFDRSEMVLLYQDIRDVIAQGFVVNDHDVLAKPDDLVRLSKLIRLGFDLKGMRVVTVGGQRLGKVSDYAIEVETMYIQKFYVTQGFMKGLTGGNLGIDRSQVQEITKSKVVVLDPLQGGAIRAAATA